MRKNTFLLLFTVSLLTFITSIPSCNYRNKEEYLGLTTDTIVCDTTTVTYTNNIVPILSNNCYRCHGTSTNLGSGGIILQDYNILATYAADGRLYGNAAHLPGFNAMPINGEKLSDCELLQLKNWVDNGYPNN